METIWKFPLELKYEQVIEMPSTLGRNLLSVQPQDNTQYPLSLWAIVDPSQSKAKFRVLIVGTGHNIIDDLISRNNYLGTCQVKYGAPFIRVFHIFGRFL